MFLMIWDGCVHRRSKDKFTVVWNYYNSLSLIIILGLTRKQKVKGFFGRVKGAVKEFVDDHGTNINGT